MKLLRRNVRKPSKAEMQRRIDREVQALEDELRAKGIKFSIPVSGKDTKGKIYTQGE